MKRKTLVQLHIIATIIAALTISTFFTISIYAEIDGDLEVIKQVKSFIVMAMPIMVIAMPILNITGNKLSGKSQNPTILLKKKRMKWVMLNGICLLTLAILLYYISHYQTINTTFFVLQIVELILGFTNLTLILLNAKSGFQLSGKTKRKTSNK